MLEFLLVGRLHAAKRTSCWRDGPFCDGARTVEADNWVAEHEMLREDLDRRSELTICQDLGGGPDTSLRISAAWGPTASA